MSTLDATTTPVSVSLLTSTTSNASKKLIADHDGQPRSDPAHRLGITAGTLEHRQVAGLAGLQGLLQEVTTKQALVHGVHKGSTHGDLCTLVTLDTLARIAKQGGARQPDQIARSLEYLDYPEGPRLIMLDVDPSPGIVTPQSPETLIQQLADIWPVFAEVGWLATVSTRSAIKAKHTGEWLTPPAGFHVYLLVTGDVARFRDLARLRLWLAGTGYCKLASPHPHTGVSAVLERCLIDLSVFSPERLDYVAGSIIAKDAPFYQDRPAPALHPGVVLDLNALPDGTADDRQQVHALVQAARERVQPEREATVRQHIQHASPTLDAAALTHEMTARLAQTDQGILTPEHPLVFDHRRSLVTAGSVTAALDGKRLADPFEPDYRDGADAIFHWHGGRWLINSFAHGILKTYRPTSASQDAPAPDPDEPPPWQDGQDTAARQPRWKLQLITKKNGDPEPALSNILLILRNDPAWHGVFGYNGLTERTVLCRRPPYAEETDTPWKARLVTDTDDGLTNDWLQRHYKLLASTGMVASAIQIIAEHHTFHPLQDYLKSLTWDGVSRIDSWLSRYAPTTPPQSEDIDADRRAQYATYVAAVGAKTLIAGVARILEPGCKADTMTILEGEQGLLKSTLWRTLAGDEWFLDDLGDIATKDAKEALIGTWIVEFPELSAFSRPEVEQIKHFLSKKDDDFRLPYARRSSLHPRTVIFVGTTNVFDWAKDATGNRRFWPVKVYGRCDVDGIARDRDQLWAEAVVRYRQGEPWYLTGDIERIAKVEQAARLEHDDWEEPIVRYLGQAVNLQTGASGQRFTTSRDLLICALGITDATHHTPAATKRVGSLLRRQGYSPQPVRPKGAKKQIKAWVAPGTAGTAVTDEQDSDNINKDNDVTAGTAVTCNQTSYSGNNGTTAQSTQSTQSTQEIFSRTNIGESAVTPVPAVTDDFPPEDADDVGVDIDTFVPEIAPCRACHGRTYWRGASGQDICQQCHPQEKARVCVSPIVRCPACGATAPIRGLAGRRICRQCPHVWTLAQANDGEV